MWLDLDGHQLPGFDFLWLFDARSDLLRFVSVYSSFVLQLPP